MRRLILHPIRHTPIPKRDTLPEDVPADPMPSVPTLRATSEDKQVAHMAAVAIGLSMIDAAFPSPIPGIKPGLANIVTLIALQWYGWRVTAWVVGLRVIASALLVGSLLTPGFWLSLAGAGCSLLILAPFSRLPKRWLGPVGLSVIAAMFHLLGQWLVARYWLIPSAGLVYLLPPLATAALITGCINGLIAARWLTQHPHSTPIETGP
ncbi:Gx transporter family protein [Parachitinimonas caeni]|uniref:Gx transporter family protein n=1 Tax=Parachitinimonas caeni TaxID=3031301 RepID=A0ABT7DSZ8_9NEIS|nr:Gx transporter family protein [Parachitinimonas caeni]MDK2123187.1 Gx transporter family protein [Parachitinimonas caeni]